MECRNDRIGGGLTVGKYERIQRVGKHSLVDGQLGAGNQDDKGFESSPSWEQGLSWDGFAGNSDLWR